MLSKNRMPEQQCITFGEMNIIFNSRTLWRQLAIWTRALIISKTAGIGIAEEVFRRVYRVPEGYANMLRIVFGNKISEDYMILLSAAVSLYNQIITAYLDGDTDTVNDLAARLYENADERATFLSSINPYWDVTEWRDLMYTYVAYTLEEIVTSITGEHAKNIDVYDRILSQASAMGDYFSQGLFNYMTQIPSDNENQSPSPFENENQSPSPSDNGNQSMKAVYCNQYERSGK
ncbi:hypothetical protein KCX82_17270 [Clostridiales bacterium BAD-6]|uniref:Uncharacterized protein n=2 Tax=Sinanaerobacter chloroacetimidivorans TaxID=2818044 RepID=A0A8J7W2E4_9FIRM|nr:hypothetical protein [Sinanaerobacter chloroacetimidivorans]